MTSHENRFCRRDIPFWRQWVGGWTFLVLLSTAIYLFRLIPDFKLEQVVPESRWGDIAFHAVMYSTLLLAFVLVPFIVHWIAYSCVAEPAIRLAQEKMEMRIIGSKEIEELPRISPGEDLGEESG